MREKVYIKQTLEIDENLFHLYKSLIDLQSCNFPDSINERLNDFIIDLSNMIFSEFKDYNIVSEKMFLETTFEK